MDVQVAARALSTRSSGQPENMLPAVDLSPLSVGSDA